jgi:hypothetical protein
MQADQSDTSSAPFLVAETVLFRSLDITGKWYRGFTISVQAGVYAPALEK